jgi:DNA primase catalytic core
MPLTEARVAALNEQAAAFYETAFPGSPAEAYMLGRGISPATLRAWRVGYAPRHHGLVSQFQREGIGDGTLYEAGFMSDREGRLYEMFADRIMLPIMDEAERVLGFGSRRLDDSDPTIPKYMNTRTTPLFHKGQVVYGLANLPAIKAAKEVFIVEGNLDLLSLVDAGINNVVAPCGTALTPEQLALVSLTKTTKITLCFDADPAGQDATRKALLNRATLALDLGVLTIPSGPDGAKRDPDDVVHEGGAALWRSLAGRRSSRWNWLWRDERASYRAGIEADHLDAIVAWKDAWCRLVMDYAKNKAEALRLLKPLEEKVQLPPESLYREYEWTMRKRLSAARAAAKANRAKVALAAKQNTTEEAA